MTETYLGSICKRGHPGIRYRSSRECVDCCTARGALPGNKARRAAYAAVPEHKAKLSARAKANKQYIRLKKEGQVCLDCQRPYPPEVFDFDHRLGTKKLFNLALPGTRSVATIDAEIAKCDLVCANCHRIRTVVRRKTKK